MRAAWSPSARLSVSAWLIALTGAAAGCGSATVGDGTGGGTGGNVAGTGGHDVAGSGGASVGTGGATPGGHDDAGSGGAPVTPVHDAGDGPAAPSSGDASYGLAGPSRCAGAGVALCESFENGLDATVWRTTKGGDGTVTVDDLHAARGSKALHVHSGGGGMAYITERSSFPATSGDMYARMFLWLQDDITTDGHFSLAEGAGTGTPAAIRFGGQFKEFGVGSDRGASGDWTDHDNKKVPSQVWMCVEIEFKGDTSEFRVWKDEVELTALHAGPSKHRGFTMPTFTSLWFGWWMYNANEPQDLWIDEIAIDSKPIGCAR